MRKGNGAPPQPIPAVVAALGAADPRYPARLRRWLGERAPATVWAMGDVRLLARPTLALFASARCPGNVILRTLDLALALRARETAVVSGFHTPLERECLRLLLRGVSRGAVVVCPARGIAGWRVPAAWREAIVAGRLLVLSPFGPEQRRVVAVLAETRNRFAAALTDEVLVAHAARGGRTLALAQEVAARGQPLLTLDSPDNAPLRELGARPVTLATFI